MQPIIDAWTKRQESVRSAIFRWTSKDTIGRGSIMQPRPTHPERPEVPVTDTVVQYPSSLILDGTKTKYTNAAYTFDQQQCMEQATYTSVWDGENAKSYRTPCGGIGLNRGIIERARTNRDASNLATWPVVLTYRALAPIGGVFKITDYALSGQVAEVDRHQCLLLEEASAASQRPGSWRRTLWVDPEQGYCIVRMTSQVRGSVRLQTDISYDRDKESGYYPREWKTTQFNDDGPLGYSSTSTVTTHEINPLVAATEFKLEFPPKTWVNNSNTREMSFILDDGSQHTIQADELANNHNLDAAYESASREAARAKWRAWGYACVALIASGLAVWLVYRGLRSRLKPLRA